MWELNQLVYSIKIINFKIIAAEAIVGAVPPVLSSTLVSSGSGGDDVVVASQEGRACNAKISEPNDGQKGCDSSFKQPIPQLGMLLQASFQEMHLFNWG